jgi:hypothetical protein
MQIWKIATHGDHAVRLGISFPNDVALPTMISLRASRLAISLSTSQTSVGRLVFDESSRRWRDAVFYGSSHSEDEMQVSPNGEWVAFCSTRSGNREVWRSRPDGSQAMQLTSCGTSRPGSPRWSPDSQWIAYDLADEATYSVDVVSAEGGKSRKLTTDAEVPVRPWFSNDGKWINCRSVKRFVRIPFEGGPAQTVVSMNNPGEAFESVDGRWLYFIAGTNNREVYRLPLSGGSQQAGEVKYRMPDATAWALAGNHVYFGIAKGDEPARIVRMDTETLKEEEIFRFPADAVLFRSPQTSLAVSRDEQSLYYMYRKREDADIVMVEPFR